MGGPGRPTRMSRSAISTLVGRSRRYVRWIRLLVPQVGDFLVPAMPAPAAGGRAHGRSCWPSVLRRACA